MAFEDKLSTEIAAQEAVIEGITSIEERRDLIEYIGKLKLALLGAADRASSPLRCWKGFA